MSAGTVLRVLRPGGRVLVFDEFAPEGDVATTGRRILNGVMRFSVRTSAGGWVT